MGKLFGERADAAMDRLSYATLGKQGYKGYLLKDATERVLQFGEGAFLRGFTDLWIDILNERGGFQGKVVAVTPTGSPSGRAVMEKLNRQEGLYTLTLRGQKDGEKVSERRVVSSISRCLCPQTDFEAFLSCAGNPDLRFITSNTTEAGIVYDPAARFEDTPPVSFPGKLCRFLYERWRRGLRGFILLPCELVDDNGGALRAIVLRHAADWGLEAAFISWVKEENLFCSTLVDRIVTGYPRGEEAALWGENGYEDELLVCGELFGFWAIQGPPSLLDELPIQKAGLGEHILVTEDCTPYKERKVRILNGAHTAFVPAAYLSGRHIVRECMEDAVIRGFLGRAIYEEIIPTVTALPEGELRAFADAVADRFGNPFIDHQLLSISLNCTSKWRARILPSLLGYVERKGALPPCLTFSFAAYLAFYWAGALEGGVMKAVRPDGETYTVADEGWVLEFFDGLRGSDSKTLVQAVCACERMWGRSLLEIPGFSGAVADILDEIDKKGIYEVMKERVNR